MRALRFIALAVILAALLILPATNRTVQSIAGTQEADQANVAKTTDSTWTSGSVDLEGVPEDEIGRIGVRWLRAAFFREGRSAFFPLEVIVDPVDGHIARCRKRIGIGFRIDGTMGKRVMRSGP